MLSCWHVAQPCSSKTRSSSLQSPAKTSIFQNIFLPLLDTVFLFVSGTTGEKLCFTCPYNLDTSWEKVAAPTTLFGGQKGILSSGTRKEECPFPALDPGGGLELKPAQSGQAVHLRRQTDVLNCQLPWDWFGRQSHFYHQNRRKQKQRWLIVDAGCTHTVSSVKV